MDSNLTPMNIIDLHTFDRLGNSFLENKETELIRSNTMTIHSDNNKCYDNVNTDNIKLPSRRTRLNKHVKEKPENQRYVISLELKGIIEKQREYFSIINNKTNYEENKHSNNRIDNLDMKGTPMRVYLHNRIRKESTTIRGKRSLINNNGLNNLIIDDNSLYEEKKVLKPNKMKFPTII